MKTPYPFQQEAIAQALKVPGFLVADECGLGKTLTAIEIAKLVRYAFPWRCLVICPPSLIAQWCDAISEQTMGTEVMVVNRLPLDFQNLSGWFVMSVYDLSSIHVRSALSTVIFDVVIVDEAHRMKNRKTKTAEWIKHINVPRRIALTGTPMEKNPADLWSILNWLQPDAFPVYWGWVMNNLEVTEGFFEKYKVGGPKDPAAFAGMLRPYMIRRTKEQVAPQLPEKIVIEQRVSMPAEQQELHDAIRTQTDIEAKVWDKTILIPNALAMLVRLQQIASDPHLLGFDVPSGKLQWLDDFLTDHPDEPTVIFSKFRDVAIGIAEKYSADIVIGGRREYDPNNCKLLVGTIDAMGEGLNLQWAKNAIFIDAHWSTIKMTQAIDRIHRIDIKEPKNIYLLWSCHEDLLVLKAINEKWTESELVYYFLDRVDEVP